MLRETAAGTEAPYHRIAVMMAVLVILYTVLCSSPGLAAGVDWVRRSTTTGDLPVPNEGQQQTCCVVCDIDKDGVDDFVVGERTRAPSVVWYKFSGKGWKKYVIDDTHLKPEAGGVCCDIDKDGDPDLILGQDASGNAIWWWENPYPEFSRPWKRRYIKNSGPSKHHDQTVADFDGDGKPELLSWNQRAKQLLLYEIPKAPKSSGPWTSTAIYSWSSGREREGFPSIPTDIDQDGKVDIVGGGRWFKHKGAAKYEENVVDEDMAFTQCAAGQLVKGGWAEIVFSPGDMDGEAKWYQWDGKKWQGHKLRYVKHGHTCEIRDVDGDGNLDIMIGEMGEPGAGDDANVYVWYGDGKGEFTETVALHGQGIHEGLFGDFDGDDDLDILVKPYHHKSPRIDILLNGGTAKRDGWITLFSGRKDDLKMWQNASGGRPKWVIKDDALAGTKGAGMIWTKRRFGDFILDLEFKTEGNSGVFFRTDNMKDPVQTGFEMQVNKPVAGKPNKNSCGSIYDALAPTEEVSKAGQWNRVTITARGKNIEIVMNGTTIIEMDLNEWDTPGVNPARHGGQQNKFRTALKDFRGEGHVGFQDHGANVWYRNVRIKPLQTEKP